MTDNTLNLNTLFASIIDALASATAEKMQQRTELLIDERVDEKLKALPVGKQQTEDELHDIVVSAVDEYMDDNRKIERKVDDAIDAIDWDGKVTEVLGNTDLSDYIDVNDALDMSSIYDAIDEKIDEIDWSQRISENIDVDKKVSDAIGDIDFDEYFDFAGKADEYFDNNFTHRFDERFDERMKEITDKVTTEQTQAGSMTEDAVRKIVREEMRLVLAQMIESTKQ